MLEDITCPYSDGLFGNASQYIVHCVVNLSGSGTHLDSCKHINHMLCPDFLASKKGIELIAKDPKLFD